METYYRSKTGNNSNSRNQKLEDAIAVIFFLILVGILGKAIMDWIDQDIPILEKKLQWQRDEEIEKIFKERMCKKQRKILGKRPDCTSTAIE